MCFQNIEVLVLPVFYLDFRKNFALDLMQLLKPYFTNNFLSFLILWAPCILSSLLLSTPLVVMHLINSECTSNFSGQLYDSHINTRWAPNSLLLLQWILSELRMTDQTFIVTQLNICIFNNRIFQKKKEKCWQKRSFKYICLFSVVLKKN